jgi:hypothetical protein
MALEITRLVDRTVLASSSFLLKMGESLTRLAEAESLGSWTVAVKEGPIAKTLEPALAEFMAGVREEKIATWADRNLALNADPLPDDLTQLGLLSALKRPGRAGVHVLPQVSGGPSTASGFSNQLGRCVLDKEDVLREARPRTTHLAVVVEDTRLVADPRLSPTPTLSANVDYLWVFLSDFGPPRYGNRVWRVHGGSSSWELHWPQSW